MTRRKLEELNLIDDYLMSCVAGDPFVGELCIKRMLSVLLDREIAHVRVTAQRVFPGADTDLRGIRMDVEVEELSESDGVENVASVYDIEPHTSKSVNLPHRNRFYQAKIDSRRLPSGERDFAKLPDLYVIMITSFDPFEKNRMVYTFRNQCVEEPELEYQDGLAFVYFYTNGKTGGSQAVKNMLDYIQKSVVSDDATKEIDGYVSSVKSDPAVKEGFMTLGEHFDWERQEGRQERQREDILELLEDIGPVPEAISERLEEIVDPTELSRLLKAAARAGSMEEFETAMGLYAVV